MHNIFPNYLYITIKSRNKNKLIHEGAQKILLGTKLNPFDHSLNISVYMKTCKVTNPISFSKTY